jgi:hypothetical protein
MIQSFFFDPVAAVTNIITHIYQYQFHEDLQFDQINYALLGSVIAAQFFFEK